MNKPKEIVELESFIVEKTKELHAADDLQTKLKNQRAEVAFKEGKEALRKIDAQIQEAEKDFEFLETQIEGAKKQIKVEVEKWIKAEEKEREKEVEGLLKQANEIEIETNKLIEALKELNGQEFLIMWSQGKPRAEKVRSYAYSRRNNVSDIRNDIKKEMGMQ